MWLVTFMKAQTGIRIESEIWQAYREVCRREKQRPGQPIEDFLRIVLENDSALSTLRIMWEAAKSRIGGVEAYARVLLDWFLHDKFWIDDGKDDVSVELLLLDCLKTVSDKNLQTQIKEALIDRQRRNKIA
jgi:hypothetical protein